MKNLKKIICSAIIMVIATIGIIEHSKAQIGGGISSPILWIINGSGDLTPSIASQPISVYDLEVTNAFTLGGTVGSGGIDMNGEIITNIGNAGTDFVASTGALTLAGNLSVGGIVDTGAWEATDIGVAHGGTGKSDWTQYLIPYADTTTSFSQIAIGTNGQVLTSNGAGSVASFEDAAAGGQILYDAIVAPSGGDYTDIQSAIDAGKHKLFVRAGTYTLSADITFAVNETVIMCESWDTIIAAGASYKIDMSSRSNSLIQNCKITGSRTDVATIYHGTSGDNNTIKGNFLDVSYGIRFDEGSYNKIINNTITGTSGTWGARVDDNYGSIINNNIIYNFGTSSSGVNVTGIHASNHNVVNNNTFYNVGGSNANIVVGVSASSYCTVSGNHLYKINANNSSGTAKGIYIGSYGNASGNYLYEIGYVSAYRTYGIESGSYGVIAGNSLNRIGYAFSDSDTKVLILGSEGVISGNNIFNAQAGSGKYLYYIYIGFDSNVNGNYIYNVDTTPTAYGVYIVGTGINVIGNKIVPTNITPIASSSVSNIANVSNNMGVDPLIETKLIYTKNTSGGEVLLGDIITIKAVAAGNEFTVTTTQGDDLVYGMVTSTIADNASGYIQTLGKTTVLKVDGTADIAIGDFIGTFTTAKIGMKATAGDMAFAIALEAYTTDDSAGVIDALIITPRKL